MGRFYTGCRVENIPHRSKGETIPKPLVNTGSEYTWISEAILDKLGIEREKKEFIMANGQKVTRSVGFAIVRVNSYFTVDEWFLPKKVICFCWGTHAGRT
jgi:hypothetical protein